MPGVGKVTVVEAGAAAGAAAVVGGVCCDVGGVGVAVWAKAGTAAPKTAIATGRATAVRIIFPLHDQEARLPETVAMHNLCHRLPQ